MASRQSSVLPAAPAPCEITVARKQPRRPGFSRDLKIALVAQSMQRARENNINDYLLFIFRGRRGDMIKALWAGQDGLCLVTRCQEQRRLVWPVREGVWQLLTANGGDLSPSKISTESGD